jgi:hypothetical protein
MEGIEDDYRHGEVADEGDLVSLGLCRFYSSGRGAGVRRADAKLPCSDGCRNRPAKVRRESRESEQGFEKGVWGRPFNDASRSAGVRKVYRRGLEMNARGKNTLAGWARRASCGKLLLPAMCSSDPQLALALAFRKLPVAFSLRYSRFVICQQPTPHRLEKLRGRAWPLAHILCNACTTGSSPHQDPAECYHC